MKITDGEMINAINTILENAALSERSRRELVRLLMRHEEGREAMISSLLYKPA